MQAAGEDHQISQSQEMHVKCERGSFRENRSVKGDGNILKIMVMVAQHGKYNEWH